MIRWFILLDVVAVCVSAHTPILDDVGPWTTLIRVVFSRGIYIVLAILIISCMVINTFTRKPEEGNATRRLEAATTTRVEDGWYPSGSFWKSNLFTVGNEVNLRKCRILEDTCAPETVREMLREAETRNDALKKELENVNKIRLELESRTGTLEREKTEALDELEQTKYEKAIEAEAIKKETAIAHRHLQQVLEEKQLLEREVECANREARITDSALMDQQRLTCRLEEARGEMNRLRSEMEMMKAERDAAVNIASDLAVRARGASSEQSHVIGDYIRREIDRGGDGRGFDVEILLGHESEMESEGGEGVCDRSGEEMQEDQEEEPNVRKECFMERSEFEVAGYRGVRKEEEEEGREVCQEAVMRIEVEREGYPEQKEAVAVGQELTSERELTQQEPQLSCTYSSGSCCKEEERYELGDLEEGPEGYVPRPVTGSVAFRNFLINSFSEPPLFEPM